MTAAVNRFRRLPLLFLLLATSAAADPAEDGSDRFVPSFTFHSGVHVQDWDAEASSRICRDCDLSDPMAVPAAPQAPASGDDRDVTPFVTGSFDLLTPELPIFGAPRLVVGGEFGGTFGTDRKVAREGDPSTAGSPLPPNGAPPFPPEQATGQGTELIAEYGDFVYGAHLGVVFPFEMLGRSFRLRPSFGWTRFEVEFEGRVVDAECGTGGGVCNSNNPGGGFLRGVTILGRDEETFDAIGPGLELEMHTGRLGPFGTSILVGLRAYKVLGDTDVDFGASLNTPPDPAGDDDYSARFQFEMDEWLYRAGVGFRLEWLGSPLD